MGLLALGAGVIWLAGAIYQVHFYKQKPIYVDVITEVIRTVPVPVVHTTTVHSISTVTETALPAIYTKWIEYSRSWLDVYDTWVYAVFAFLFAFVLAFLLGLALWCCGCLPRKRRTVRAADPDDDDEDDQGPGLTTTEDHPGSEAHADDQTDPSAAPADETADGDVDSQSQTPAGEEVSPRPRRRNRNPLPTVDVGTQFDGTSNSTVPDTRPATQGVINGPTGTQTEATASVDDDHSTAEDAATLQQRNEYLEKKIEKLEILKKEVENATSWPARVVRENRKLQAKLENSNAELKKMSSKTEEAETIEQLLDKVAELNGELTDCQAHRDFCTKEPSEQEAELKRLRDENKRLSKVNDRLHYLNVERGYEKLYHEQKEEHAAEKKQLEDEIEFQKNSAYDTAKAEAQAELDKEKDKHEVTKALLEECQKQLEKCHKHGTQLTGDNESLKEQVSNLEKSVAQAEQDLATAKAMNGSLRMQKDSAWHSVEGLEKQIRNSKSHDACTKRQSEMQATIDALKTEAERWKSLHAELAEKQQSDKGLSDCNSNQEALQSANDALNKEVAALKKQVLDSRKAKHDALEKDIAALKEKLDESEEANKDSRKKLEDCNGNTNTLQETVDALQKEIEALKKRLDDALKSNQQLQTQFEGAQDSQRQVQSSLDECNKKSQELEQKNQKLQEANSGLQKQAAEVTSQQQEEPPSHGEGVQQSEPDANDDEAQDATSDGNDGGEDSNSQPPASAPKGKNWLDLVRAATAERMKELAEADSAEEATQDGEGEKCASGDDSNDDDESEDGADGEDESEDGADGEGESEDEADGDNDASDDQTAEDTNADGDDPEEQASCEASNGSDATTKPSGGSANTASEQSTEVFKRPTLHLPPASAIIPKRPVSLTTSTEADPSSSASTATGPGQQASSSNPSNNALPPQRPGIPTEPRSTNRPTEADEASSVLTTKRKAERQASSSSPFADADMNNVSQSDSDEDEQSEPVSKGRKILAPKSKKRATAEANASNEASPANDTGAENAPENAESSMGQSESEPQPQPTQPADQPVVNPTGSLSWADQVEEAEKASAAQSTERTSPASPRSESESDSKKPRGEAATMEFLRSIGGSEISNGAKKDLPAPQKRPGLKRPGLMDSKFAPQAPTSGTGFSAPNFEGLPQNFDAPNPFSSAGNQAPPRFSPLPGATPFGNVFDQKPPQSTGLNASRFAPQQGDNASTQQNGTNLFGNAFNQKPTGLNASRHAPQQNDSAPTQQAGTNPPAAPPSQGGNTGLFGSIHATQPSNTSTQSDGQPAGTFNFDYQPTNGNSGQRRPNNNTANRGGRGGHGGNRNGGEKRDGRNKQHGKRK